MQELLSDLSSTEQLHLINLKRVCESDLTSKSDLIDMFLITHKAHVIAQRLILNLMLNQASMNYDAESELIFSRFNQMG